MTKTLTIKRLHYLLSYDAGTGLFSGNVPIQGRKSIHVGSVLPNGRRYITVDYKKYLSSRLVWFFVYGKWPNDEIDHINGNPSDDRISNLREANRSENMSNMKKRVDNKSGYKGVCWCERDKLWVTQIVKNKKNMRIGRSKSLKVAYAIYCRAAKKYHGEFARLA